MEVTINLPDKLTQRLQDQWSNLPQEILHQLVLKAFKEGLVNFDEFKELGDFKSEAELNEFLKQNNMLHASGLLNLYGTCADIDFELDDLGISDEMDDNLEGLFDD